MEMTIASHHDRPSSSSDSRKDKGDFKKNPRSLQSSTKEPMIILTNELVRIPKKA